MNNNCNHCGKGVGERDIVYTGTNTQLSQNIKDKYGLLCKECLAGFVQQGNKFDTGTDIDFKVLSDEDYSKFELTLNTRTSKWYEYFKIVIERPKAIVEFMFKDIKTAASFKVAINNNKKKFPQKFKVQQAGKRVVIKPLIKENL